MSTRVAVVTGGNKGIGYEIVKELCKKFDGVVYLTARNVGLGETAVEALKKDGHNPAFHQLDISDQESIDKFADYIRKKYDGLDVLVNNAAIGYKIVATKPIGEQAETTVRINFTGVLNTCKALFPLLRSHARVVNVSSSVGMLSNIPSPELKQKFNSLDLTEGQLCKLMSDFVEAAKAGKHKEQGWACSAYSAYSMSKIGLTALSMLQQREFLTDKREDIIVNAVHPGYVDTDMTNHLGHLKPEQGAEAPSYLALLPPNATEPKGQMVWNDKRVVDWSQCCDRY